MAVKKDNGFVRHQIHERRNLGSNEKQQVLPGIKVVNHSHTNIASNGCRIEGTDDQNVYKVVVELLIPMSVKDIEIAVGTERGFNIALNENKDKSLEELLTSDNKDVRDLGHRIASKVSEAEISGRPPENSSSSSHYSEEEKTIDDDLQF